ncbi:MAG: hypothetical protein Q4B87_01705 [Candidatus Saccharibacteria bacterium]|nr:hypothetical protein [Candidatus Saccharibacteria bacterium]
MKREKSFYQNCQAMLNFGFVGKEEIESPEVMALVVALNSQASVTLALKYHVYMVGEAAFSEGHGLPDQGVITSRVRSIEFENVRYADGVERKELHIWTDSGKFLAWCDDDGLTPEMAEMLVRIRAEKHSFADYVRYFTKISFKHPYYELTA